MMPRLKAEEALERIQVTAVATRSMPADSIRRSIAAYESASRGGQRIKGTTPDPSTLGSIGIGVRRVAAHGD
jgi:hypothetical protein